MTTPTFSRQWKPLFAWFLPVAYQLESGEWRFSLSWWTGEWLSGFCCWCRFWRLCFDTLSKRSNMRRSHWLSHMHLWGWLHRRWLLYHRLWVCLPLSNQIKSNQIRFISGNMAHKTSRETVNIKRRQTDSFLPLSTTKAQILLVPYSSARCFR